MIKVSLIFPNSDSTRFDMDYYCNSHIPMVLEKLGTACRRVAVEEGLVGASPDLPPSFVAMGHLYFKSMNAFKTAFDSHAAAILEDVPNYTNVEPNDSGQHCEDPEEEIETLSPLTSKRYGKRISV